MTPAIGTPIRVFRGAGSAYAVWWEGGACASLAAFDVGSCWMRVDVAGRAEALRLGAPTLHAWIEGTYLGDRGPAPAIAPRITYRLQGPDTFQCLGAALAYADQVRCDSWGCFRVR